MQTAKAERGIYLFNADGNQYSAPARSLSLVLHKGALNGGFGPQNDYRAGGFQGFQDGPTILGAHQKLWIPPDRPTLLFQLLSESVRDRSIFSSVADENIVHSSMQRRDLFKRTETSYDQLNALIQIKYEILFVCLHVLANLFG